MTHCIYCGVGMVLHHPRKGQTFPPNAYTRDHIIPRAQGGLHYTVGCCYQCNQDKGRFTIAEWRAALSVRYRRVHLFWWERQIWARIICVIPVSWWIEATRFSLTY